MTNHSRVPSSLVEITSERIASSVARPPALRITWASPSARPAYLAGIHAGQDGKSPRGRHGELAPVAETGRIGFVSGEHFLQDRSHDESLLEKRPLCSYLFRSNSNSRNDDSSVKRSCPQTPARTAMVIF